MGNELVSKTDLTFDTEKALTEANKLLKKFITDEDFQEKKGYQISLVHRESVSGEERYFDGTKALWQNGKKEAYEDEFNTFNKDLKGSYLEEIHSKVMSFSGGRLRRYRLMWLNSKNCYLFHQDKFEPDRFHLALDTNENCLLLYKKMHDVTAYHIPRDGHLYKVNAGVSHTALNAGESSRLHLLFTLGEDNS